MFDILEKFVSEYYCKLSFSGELFYLYSNSYYNIERCKGDLEFYHDIILLSDIIELENGNKYVLYFDL